MSRSQRRLLILVLSLPVLVVVVTLFYQLGMRWLEGEPRTFWQALEWAGETLSTTGYGRDASWQHPVMVLYVTLVQFVGVFWVFLLIPIYLIPFLEERFESRLPRQVPPLAGHVVIYGYGAAVTSLIEEVEEAGLEVLVIESQEAEARLLLERGKWVLHRRLEDGALELAHLVKARALIANASDDENAAVVLAARQLGFSGDILTLVEAPLHRKPMMLAGSTAVYTPRHMLGAALAARASRRLSSPVAGFEQVGGRLQVTEVRIRPDSPVAGRTLAEAGIGARTGATVIGQWLQGKLTYEVTPETELAANGILVVVGTAESIQRLIDLAFGAFALRQHGAFIIGGHGEVGSKVAELLRDAGEEVRVIDRRPGPGVDLVGDVLDVRLLQQAGVEEAQAFIVALDQDSATLFATVILKDLVPQLPIIARVNQAGNVARIHRAGAEFALSISQVSGQMLARRLLGEQAVSVDSRLKVARVRAHRLAGCHPSELGIRERTGCSVVAVERGEETLMKFGPEFRFAAGDEVYVCGSHEAVRRFTDVFD